MRSFCKAIGNAILMPFYFAGYALRQRQSTVIVVSQRHIITPQAYPELLGLHMAISTRKARTLYFFNYI